MMEYCVLASGSKGNCCFVASAKTRVLIDCGVSAKEAARRLAQIGVDADTIDALIVTHEHDDHISGIRVFSKRHRAAIYANQKTFAAAGGFPDAERLTEFAAGRGFVVGDLSFEPFSIPHDAADPVGFRIHNGSGVLGLATDLGHVTTLVRERVRDVDALILESNHDLELLHQCSYPWPLKQRIKGKHGHLSNNCAGELLEEISACPGARLRVVVAAHISENSNTPELALAEFNAAWRRGGGVNPPQFAAAAPDRTTGLYSL